MIIYLAHIQFIFASSKKKLFNQNKNQKRLQDYDFEFRYPLVTSVFVSSLIKKDLNYFKVLEKPKKGMNLKRDNINETFTKKGRVFHEVS